MKPLAPRTLGAMLFLAGAAAGIVGVLGWQRWQPTVLLPSHIEATLYLPLVDNAGRRFPDEQWQQAIQLLTTEVGGATLGAEHEGWWVNERQEVQREPVRVVLVTFPRERLPAFEIVVQQLGQKLGQDAIFSRLEEVHVRVTTIEKNP